MLFLLFVGVIAYIINKKFPLFRYSMVVVTCLYIALSFSHPDYWIAKVNLESTQETRSEFFKGETYGDYNFLANLNADAAPVMLEWIGEEGYSFDSYYVEGVGWVEDKNGVDQKEWCAYLYLKHLRQNCKDVSIREFNLSRFLADYEVLLYESNKGM